MTPAQARAFRAVAAEGSFTAAAKALNLSQPTLTTQVNAIEKRYNVELFHRSSRGVHLTSTGAHLLSIVRRMFNSYDEAIAYLEEVHGMRRGHIRVGSYGPYDVTRILSRYNERHPGIQISLTFANSREIAHRLLDYDIDVGICGRMEPREELLSVPFSKPRLIIIAPRSEAWNERSSIKPAELASHCIILREAGSAARQAFEMLLLQSGVVRTNYIEVGSREGVVSAVAAGLGVSAIFDEGLLPEDKIVRLAITGSAIQSHVDVMCLKERRNNLPIRSFLAIARELSSSRQARL
jgi:LysR family transcriptional regulator, low CO2-responsive transcriptional regulator